MKKLSILVCLVLILTLTALLTGCSGQQASVSSPASSETSPTPETPKPTWTVVKEVDANHPTNYSGFLNDTIGVTVGYMGEIHTTKDGGTSWPRAENKSSCRYSLDIVNENFIVAGGNMNEIRFSKDGGKKWEGMTNFNGGGFHYHICFIDENTGWLGSKSKMAATQDGGKTWTEIALPEGEKRIQALFLRTANDGYLMTPEGMFYTTKDGGKTWDKQDLNIAQFGIEDVMTKKIRLTDDNSPVADINFTDANNGSIVLIGNVKDQGVKAWVMTTSDAGVAWKTEELQLPEGYKPATVYMTKDNQYLTLNSLKGHIVLYRKAE